MRTYVINLDDALPNYIKQRRALRRIGIEPHRFSATRGIDFTRKRSSSRLAFLPSALVEVPGPI